MNEQIFNFINKQQFELSVRLNDGKALHIANVKNCIVDQYEAIQRVRELHKQNEIYCNSCGDDRGGYALYPCPTIRALDGTDV